MTPEVREDAGVPLIQSADRHSPGEDLKSVAQAGFEAGLAVIIQAMPTASIVIDTSCRVLASNIRARDLVRRLDKHETKGALSQAAAQASLGTEPGLVTLEDGGKTRDYFIVPLPGSSARGKTLFLVGRVPDETAGHSRSYAPMQSDAAALSPVGVLREQALKFKRLSETDALTGALNVRAFSACVRQTLAHTTGRKGAMIFLDLNDFKAINDRFGHAAGDKVLIHIAQRLTFPSDTWIATARLGGDEFALWVPFVERSGVPKIIDCIRKRLKDPIDVSEHGTEPSYVTVTAAIGAAHCPEDALTYESMRRLADDRMYDDKARAG